MQKELKISADKLLIFLILGMMFLSAMDFVNRFYVFAFLAFLFFVLTPSRRIHFDTSFFALVALTVSLIAFDNTYQTGILNLLKAFPFLLCYMMGRSLYATDSNRESTTEIREKQFTNVTYLMALGTFSHFALNMIVNWGRGDRSTIEFWSRKALSATGQATLGCIMIAVAVAVLFSKAAKRYKIVAGIALAVIVAYNLILAGRTIFVLIAIALVAAYFFQRFSAGVGIWNFLKTVAIFAVIVTVVLTLYNVNLFGIKTRVEDSNFYDRFFDDEYSQEIEEDARFEYKLEYLENFTAGVLGGGKIRRIVGHHAHDIYLDTYDQASIFALGGLLVYIVMSVLRVVECVRRKNISFEVKQLVFCVYLIVNVQFWTEPILEGSPWLFALYCFMDGSLAHLLAETKE